jgi:hypothetical protein
VGGYLSVVGTVAAAVKERLGQPCQEAIRFETGFDAPFIVLRGWVCLLHARQGRLDLIYLANAGCSLDASLLDTRRG